MITKDILKKVRRIEIKTRGLVNNIFSGEYHTVFKGRGMSFSEVREYQFGDEVRFIDWNVSARMDRPYLKVFEEEREQTLMVLFDASASGNFGTVKQTKMEMMIEMAALIAFSAIKNNDKVGLLIFTDIVEKFIPPKKGKSHVLRIIRELLTFKPQRKATKISAALEYAMHVLNRRSIVFLMSDFLDANFDRPLRAAAKKHDLIAIRIFDRREIELPKVGILTLEDEETGELVELDTSSEETRQAIAVQVTARTKTQKDIFRKSKVDLIDMATGTDYVEALIQFFKNREKRLQRG
ncbi:DUF58 domain-containing protein [bacterium]|nr:MAG: DUF58 domain-containing protein [bacterium]